MRQLALVRLIQCMLLLCGCVAVGHAAQWRTLAPGLQYIRIPQPTLGANSHVHAFRIDQRRYHLALALAQPHATATVRDLAQQHHALLAINGGFFTPDAVPLGLRMQDGVVRHPAKAISWWSVFYSTQQHAHLVDAQQFIATPNTELALQAGPLLLRHGRIQQRATTLAERSAVGIDHQQRLILLTTQNAPLSLTQLATLLQSRTYFHCRDAMNLDGGSSAQAYAAVPPFTLDIANLSRVTDAILVLPART